MAGRPVTDTERGGSAGNLPETSGRSVTQSDVRPSVAARPLIGGVRLYQLASSGRPSPCRHVPSCSTYAKEALESHGAIRGSWLAAKRLLRCHPWGTEGYDPVPEPAERKVS